MILTNFEYTTGNPFINVLVYVHDPNSAFYQRLIARHPKAVTTILDPEHCRLQTINIDTTILHLFSKSSELFEQILEKLPRLIGAHRTIRFPFKLGLDLTDYEWLVLEQKIVNFAGNNRNFTVYIVK